MNSDVDKNVYDGLLAQRESEVGVDFRGNFWVQLFLVNFIVLITNLVGDRAGEGAFSRKTPQNTQKCRKHRFHISRTAHRTELIDSSF